MTDMDMQACMAAAQPGEHHAALEPFIGTFKATVRMWMDPGSKPMESTGVMKNSWTLGNRFLRHDYEDDSGQFSGEGYWGYNNNTGEYEGLWLDTMSTGVSMDTGSVDASGKVWTMAGPGVLPGGVRVERKNVITLKDKDHHTMEMFMTMPGAGEMKVMEIAYARA